MNTVPNHPYFSSTPPKEGLVPQRQLRAQFTNEHVVVYQAYNAVISAAAVNAQRLVSPFKLTRMTWIKPSFCWMMYRSGWAQKDPGQARILRLEISREGFEWALLHSSSSSYKARYETNEQWREAVANSPVRVQWDPERDLLLNKLPWRSIQVGLRAEAALKYVNEWTHRVTDITPLVREVHQLVMQQNLHGAQKLLPREEPYPLPKEVREAIGA